MASPPDPGPGGERRCVFTTLFGAYERLNEQPVATASSVPFIAVTDDPDLTSDTWTIRHVEPLFLADPIRSQREMKIAPHRVLDDFDVSLYIDNSVLLAAPPEEIFDRYLTAETVLAVPAHSFRDSIEDEFLDVARLGFDDQSRIFEQLNHYAMTTPETLDEAVLWSAILIRRHMDPRVRRFSRVWLAHVMRYSRRDQLSIVTALRQSGLVPAVIEVDNHASWFHTWPHTPERDRNRGHRNPLRTSIPLRSRERFLETEGHTLRITNQRLHDENDALTSELGSLRKRIEELASHIDGLEASKSWRLALRLRQTAETLRRFRPHSPGDDGSALRTDPTGARSMQPVPLASGRHIYVDPDDGRGQALVAGGGHLNILTLTIWRTLLTEALWDVVVDIGANYGEMLLNVDLPAQARVIAVEPNPGILRHLRRSLEEAGGTVEVLAAAMGSQEGTAILHVDAPWSGTSRLNAPSEESGRTTPVTVDVITLASVLRRIGVTADADVLLKVDVEGSEADVLRSYDGPITALVEILHMPDNDLEWIRQNFSLRVLDAESGALRRISPDSLRALHDVLDDPRHYAQDIVIQRTR